MPTLWQHTRAAVIVAHIGVLTLACVPGYAPKAEQVFGGQATVQVLRTLAKARNRVLRPLRPYFEFLGIQQGWKMFGTVKTRSARLEVHAREAGGAWQPLYLEQTQHQWNARLLNHSRMRSQRLLFSQKKFPNRYDDMVRWLARDAIEESDWHAVRVRYQGVRTPPIEALEGTLIDTEIHWETTVLSQDLQ